MSLCPPLQNEISSFEVTRPVIAVAVVPGGSVFFLPGFPRDFDCFDSENEWDGKVVFVGF